MSSVTIYQDESGELGFQKKSSNTFVITILCTIEGKSISNIVRKFKGKIIKGGWPPEIEIKGSTLFGCPRNRQIPSTFKWKTNPRSLLIQILEKLCQRDIIIDTIAVNNKRIYKDLRTLPYGVLYNYFSGQILIPRVIKYDSVHLFVDKRNKEQHDLLDFDGYIKTEAFMNKGKNFNFNIQHVFSHEQRGIQAVDFLSWAIYRKYERRDQRFYDVLKTKIEEERGFFFPK